MQYSFWPGFSSLVHRQQIKKISRSKRRLREHWYYVNVAYKVHISVYEAYIQDVTRRTSHPLKVLDHQISHFENI